MGFLDGLGELVRDSPVMSGAQSSRYGESDPYKEAIKGYASLGYPAPGSSGDEGEAQRYYATSLAAKRYGALPLLTNAFHELVLSHFAEGEDGPSMKRWHAGNRGVFDAIKGSGQRTRLGRAKR